MAAEKNNKKTQDHEEKSTNDVYQSKMHTLNSLKIQNTCPSFEQNE